MPAVTSSSSWILMVQQEGARALDVERSSTEDTRRIEELYQRLEQPLTNVLYRWLWSREDVRDVIQDAFVKLWQMRERVEWDHPDPLVYRIALNLAANRRRRRKLWQWVTFEDQTGDEPSEAPDPEQEAAVRKAIDALPERHRRVLTLSLHGELGYDQIAEVLGISPGTVGSRRNTAVRKLREALARQDKR